MSDLEHEAELMAEIERLRATIADLMAALSEHAEWHRICSHPKMEAHARAALARAQRGQT